MINPMSLEGQNIIVTGAGQGIGEAVSRLVVDLGGKAILVDLQEDKLARLSESLGADKTEVHVGSVADPGFVQRMVDETVRNNGAVHGLVNNAGIVRAAMAVKMPIETWQQVIDVNLSGVFYCLQAVGRHMNERAEDGDTSPASIVNISSDAGRRGTIGQINYGAAKSGVMGLTMSAAREWSAKQIRVNTVCFGVVETEMTETIRSDKFRDGVMAQVPMKRFATPEEVSQPVCFLLSNAASYITGQHLSVNGGYTIGV
ncbi:SDR family NAD(P)-dependent oxidoreductase [Sneathiella chinensis]|uniref:3-oxoacyl-ACP reductase n=1 Tax=Sneathiella chinensis TaxID=349750 RepID=A0ABQ5TYP0_9PROT|nr:SDR family oxidoreductase [Sneathiella chinensis]GLQ05087.1 3-oxoacyl-ACP reductase [Sneathiella chinensis]